MNGRIRFFLLVSEFMMIGNQIKYLYNNEEQKEKRNRLVENQKVIRQEIQNIVDKAIQKALDEEPNGMEQIYKSLNIERI